MRSRRRNGIRRHGAVITPHSSRLTVPHHILLHGAPVEAGKVVLKNMGAMHPRKISGHTSSPTVVDRNKDGHLYHMENPRAGN